MMIENATFHCFKRTGKWYTQARGYLPASVFKLFKRNAMRECILAANGGTYPGLSDCGDDFIFVIFGDDNVDYGWPLMLFPRRNKEDKT